MTVSVTQVRTGVAAYDTCLPAGRCHKPHTYSSARNQ